MTRARLEGGAPSGAVERLLSVLLAFQSVGARMTLSETARATNLPISTTRRMLSELCRARLLERVGNEYQIGVRLFEIGMRAPVPNKLGEIAHPLMEDLHNATRENVHLGVLDDEGVLIIRQRSSKGSVRNPVHKKRRVAAHSTANGKCLLAFSDPAQVERTLAGGIRRVTKHTVATLDELEAQLDDVRLKGWSISEQENSLGTLSVGAPIFGTDGYAIAALSLVVPISTGNVRLYVHAVRTTATTISRLWAQANTANFGESRRRND